MWLQMILIATSLPYTFHLIKASLQKKNVEVMEFYEIMKYKLEKKWIEIETQSVVISDSRKKMNFKLGWKSRLKSRNP